MPYTQKHQSNNPMQQVSISLVTLVFIGCSYDNLLLKNSIHPLSTSGTVPKSGNSAGCPPSTSHGPIVSTDIYFLDSYQKRYWKNGVAYPRLNTGLGEFSDVNGIAVLDSDVYVVGSIYKSTQVAQGFFNDNPIAVYWKNGTRLALSDSLSGTVSGATSIAIHSSDIYIAGYYNGSPVYWKNGVMTTLPTLGPNARATSTSIAVSGSDIYVAGILRNNQRSASLYTESAAVVYWRNGVITKLIEDDHQVPLNYYGMPEVWGPDISNPTIAVNCPDVYVMTQKNMWKNNAAIPPFISCSKYQAIGFNGSDVYVAGSTLNNGEFNAVYWKNGELTQLDKNSSECSSISFSGSDVYISGWYPTGNYAGVSNNFAGGYWKNGVFSALDAFSLGQSQIVVVPRYK
jgi:hypothetical protein